MKKILFAMLMTLLILSCDEDNNPVEQSNKINLDNFIESDINYEVNKYEVVPLSVTYEFKTIIDAKLEIRIIEDFTGYVYDKELIKNIDYEIDFIGLYPGQINTIELKLINEEGDWALDTIEILTNDLPEFLPEVNVLALNEQSFGNGWIMNNYYMANNGAFKSVPYIYDRNGDIRWFMDINFADDGVSPVELIDENRLLFGFREKIWETTLSGKIINEIEIPKGWIHHDVIKHPNGNYIAAVAAGGNVKDKDGNVYDSRDDHIYEINSNGAIVTEWDLREVLDVDRYDIVEDNEDWFHMNAIEYDPRDNSLIVSGRQQGVIKIDWDNNLKWILSPHKGWGKAGWDGSGFETKDYLLTAVNSNGDVLEDNIQLGMDNSTGFEWSWGQHDPEILPNGNILIFDNGTNRNFGKYDNTTNYSRIVEYKIDEENMTVEQVWHYGKSRGNELFSPIVSAVSNLDNNNYLFCPGVIDNFNSSKILEIDPLTKEVVFEGQSTFKTLYGDGSFAWGQFDLIYRAVKINY